MSIPGMQCPHAGASPQVPGEEASLPVSSGGGGSSGLCVAVSPWHWLGACYCVLGWHPAGTGPAFCPPHVRSRHHPSLCEPSLGLMAQPSLRWHGLSRSLGWFSQTLLGVATLPGILLLVGSAASSLAGREKSTPARLRLGCPCL